MHRDPTVDVTDDGADAAFDEAWYLKAYPDVAMAIEAKIVKSALEHYLRHGKAEGRKPFSDPGIINKRPPITLLHIPKTAGTSVRAAFERAGLAVFIGKRDFQFENETHGNVDLISGHFGYRQAKAVGGDIITILRDPIDRFLSYYYHLRILYENGEDINARSQLAHKYSLDHFSDMMDEGNLLIDQYNSATWQILRGVSLEDRSAFRTEIAATDEKLLRMAINNLETFKIVGFQDAMEDFRTKVRHTYRINLELNRENENLIREYRENISFRTIKKNL